jgi:hypothetical protein
MQYFDDDYEEDDYYEPEPDVCSECGYVDYWCELCGFHGHRCEKDGEYK